MRPDWELRNCCNHEQVVFLITVSVCTVVILALWRTILLKPFKLVTVFLHEASHAIACKLTCGHVEGIQVHADEGGSTQTRGGIYWFILPAGYLGSSFWGMLFILASTNLLTARIAAGCLLVALLIVLFVAKNWTLRGLCIGFMVFLGVVWLLQETTKVHVLRYIILFIGVMNSLFSVYETIPAMRRNSLKFALVAMALGGASFGSCFILLYGFPFRLVIRMETFVQGFDIVAIPLWGHVPWSSHLVLRVQSSDEML